MTLSSFSNDRPGSRLLNVCFSNKKYIYYPDGEGGGGLRGSCETIIADPHLFDADLDPTFHFDADTDTDTNFHCDADPDPGPIRVMRKNLRPLA
jgi:hypothetical protein